MDQPKIALDRPNYGAGSVQSRTLTAHFPPRTVTISQLSKIIAQRRAQLDQDKD